MQLTVLGDVNPLINSPTPEGDNDRQTSPWPMCAWHSPCAALQRAPLCSDRTTVPGFPSDSVVKEPTCQAEDTVRSLDCEDPLEKEMATHSSVLAWEIPWMEEPGWLQSMGSQKVVHDLATKQQQKVEAPEDEPWVHVTLCGKSLPEKGDSTCKAMCARNRSKLMRVEQALEGATRRWSLGRQHPGFDYK